MRTSASASGAAMPSRQYSRRIEAMEIFVLVLRNVPDTTDVQFWDHRGPDDQGIHYVRWPADLGPHQVVVRISTVALSGYSGEPFAIDTAKN